jgi:predicted NAD/FAD-dependent oxidoreductase
MNPKLGVVGAGAGAAAATYVVDRAPSDIAVTIFEKSRGVCGRAAARRRNGIVYDYGANYLKDPGGRVRTLVTNALSGGLVEIEGPIWTFDADGTISEASGQDERRWTYTDGITRLAKHLLGRTEAAVRHETRITDLHHEDGWVLSDAGGREHGPFDALLVNPPAPQTATLLQETGVAAADRLGQAAAEVSYQTVWTAILGYEFELDVPYYALANADGAHPISWIGREECKPGHVPEGKSVLIVQAHPEWSSERYDAPPDDNLSVLAEATADLIGDPRLADPAWTDHQGWKYALVENGVRDDVLAPAAASGLHVTGDWVAGKARLHAAVRNGLETGEALRAFVRNDAFSGDAPNARGPG